MDFAIYDPRQEGLSVEIDGTQEQLNAIKKEIDRVNGIIEYMDKQGRQAVSIECGENADFIKAILEEVGYEVWNFAEDQRVISISWELLKEKDISL